MLSAFLEVRLSNQPEARKREVHWTWLFVLTGLGTFSPTFDSALCPVAEPKAAGPMLSLISSVHQPYLFALVALIKHTQSK